MFTSFHIKAVSKMYTQNASFEVLVYHSSKAVFCGGLELMFDIFYSFKNNGCKFHKMFRSRCT